ncbi:uncharacterized protein A1O9_04338 [Exophiala aquamarina CBS 119918]|uniref:Uncharacterized protein n=1 Tax=Exophiala aquamarina CBS 119918 TaxID=1182545 RepID=A0A072PH86_9EURO|nr:uncharacterized protein A1O9_04338 [Exophiala aquamarina CBS 119918]KEF59494.1 hypothetical protein A1O9_04338 [Exophiala aquamarina CBS 119918]
MKAYAAAGVHAFTRIRGRLWSLPTALVLLWALVLIWGERVVFERRVNQCRWQQWETWPTQAQPHHLLLVADPQLVDPHTYPDRPWPLSTLTVLYTDLYLGRAYRNLQQSLQPDATIFLGDLFDGGREWGTPQSSSPEERYKKYGSIFWLKEYVRFSNLFLRSWNDGGSTASRAEPAGRRILASIPGNHDLGFAAGIQPAVKSRFDAYFGPLNRIDVIGNHSFVSLDSVSLSAMDQVDPETGSSGAGDGSATATATSKIWKPVEDFLIDAKNIRARAIEHTCRTQFNWNSLEGDSLLSPVLQDAQPARPPPPAAVKRQSPAQPHHEISSASFPTIILSHVPLFRSGSTSCGPMRERGTSIPLQAGYQYQNVLTPLISQDIVKHLRQEEVTQIYSGDDHDYCEIDHNEFTGRPKEITVKSMSWAMGIRVPGVQLVSLWNPVDCEKVMSRSTPASEAPTPRGTIQNHLCLLPDQLSIFIRYGQTFGLTLVVLIVLAVRYDPASTAAAAATCPRHEKSEPLLPLSHQHNHRQHSSSTSIHNQNTTHLSTRKLGGYGQIPVSSRTSSPSKDDDEDDSGGDWAMPERSTSSSLTSRSWNRRPQSRLQYFGRNLWQVVWPVLILYLWLVWRG